MNTQEQYAAPELKLVGEADTVVLAGVSIGGDVWGLNGGYEFEAD